MQNVFGAGSMWAVNNGVSNPTPVKFGVAQNIALDFSVNTKPLFGQNQLPVSVARGTVSAKGKCGFAQLNGRLIGELFFGATASSGQILVVENEVGVVPSSPFQVTVANAANWALDLGVTDANAVPLVRVASAPAVGQYVVVAGVYSFAAADVGKSLRISYTYNSSATGQNYTLNNQAVGVAPTFKTVMFMPYNGKTASLTLNSCIANKFSLSTLLEDFAKPDFEFEAVADGNGVLGVISVAEVS